MKGYFNTFYNAEDYFRKAEKLRQANNGLVDKNSQNLYDKVILKSQKIIDNYPQFKYRDKALLLIIQSYYHNEDYYLSLDFLKKLNIEYGSNYLYNYWNAMVEWKLGKTQSSINQLINLSKNEKNPKAIRSQSFMAASRIYSELGQDSVAMTYMEKAANLSSNKEQKSRIFYDIANKKYNSNNLLDALASYKKVIKNTNIKLLANNSNLRIIQINRQIGELTNAEQLIKKLLLDESYKSIHSDLEIELAKILFDQKKINEARNRYISITENYPRSLSSAESMFQLGNHFLIIERNLIKAKEYFSKVQSENAKSLFVSASKSKIKEIEVFTELSKSYITWKDSLSNVHSEYDSVDFKRSAVLYELGELEAFHFQNPNEGLKYFIQLLDFFPESSKVPQALYSISYIHDKNNDTVKSDKIKKKLITKYPQTIYSEAILKSNDEFILERSIFEKKLVEAEKSMNVDENASILKYTNIALADTISNANMIAIFFLANYYDFNRSNPDSALKYYSMTQNSYPKTKQAEFSKLRISNINSILSDSLSINMYNIIEN